MIYGKENMVGELPGERAAMEKNAAGRAVKDAHEQLKEFVSANPDLQGAQDALNQSTQRVDSLRAGLSLDQLKEMSQATLSSLDALKNKLSQDSGVGEAEKPVESTDDANKIRAIHEQIAQLAVQNPDLRKAQELLKASNDRLIKLQGDVSAEDLDYMKTVAENALTGLRITISMRAREQV